MLLGNSELQYSWKTDASLLEALPKKYIWVFTSAVKDHVNHSVISDNCPAIHNCEGIQVTVICFFVSQLSKRFSKNPSGCELVGKQIFYSWSEQYPRRNAEPRGGTKETGLTSILVFH